MQIVLFEPEIPPNTGNIARLCAATKTRLHLIEPLGFKVDDKHLKRAGLDYWPHVDVHIHPDWNEFMQSVQPERLVMASARTGVAHHCFDFRETDCIVLGPETRGLPGDLLDSHPDHVRIPIWGEVRSLNLSTSAGILLYESLRQTGKLPR